uniref:SHSP domain-containing protein n=1 Tax=Acrobeloides nanus TaxID=290746 RepID=A0A914CVI7_9BILA
MDAFSDNPETWDWPLQAGDQPVKVTRTEDKFEVNFDTSYFDPKEIEVKLFEPNLLHVSCHKERGDLPVSRDVYRTYKLPDDVDPKTVDSRVEGGKIHVSAKKRNHI